MQRIAIIGATGSIGTQTIEIVKEHPNKLNIHLISGHSNADLLIKQAKEFSVPKVVVTDENAYKKVKEALKNTNSKVEFGQNALKDLVQEKEIDIVVAAIVGFAGLSSTLSAIQAGKKIALANKETLVVAGKIVMEEAQKHGAEIVPIDSEHSAIYQCLVGERKEDIEKIILSASGGPFIGKKTNFLLNVKKDHALQHPNWDMGAKISIDSASLMNKGLEMIEAKWLFGLNDEQIEVIVHPQSVIHSLVEFIDGSLKAQLGIPDMRIPIQYAFSLPNRWSNSYKKFSFKDFAKLTFEEADTKTFRNLELAQSAMKQCGNMPCILNAANEEVVFAFLKNKVGFIEMSDIIEKTMEKVSFLQNPTLEELVQSDKKAREIALDFIKNSNLYN